MTEQKYLYILFSATPYRMGRMIRMVTGEPYNHVSLSLEEDLTEMYAFARRYYHTPFYGGFVTEKPTRFHHRNATADIYLCRVPVTGEQWQSLRERLTQMGNRPHRYLYNHLSALAAPIHRKISIRDAYTCAEFVVSILGSVGLDFDPRRFYTIGSIAQILSRYHIYTGPFPVPPEEDLAFFHPHPVSHPIYRSTRDILRLLWRMATA